MAQRRDVAGFSIGSLGAGENPEVRAVLLAAAIAPLPAFKPRRGGVLDNAHSTDVISPPPPPRVCMSIIMLRSRFECLCSMTLLPGT